MFTRRPAGRVFNFGGAVIERCIEQKWRLNRWGGVPKTISMPTELEVIPSIGGAGELVITPNDARITVDANGHFQVTLEVSESIRFTTVDSFTDGGSTYDMSAVDGTSSTWSARSGEIYGPTYSSPTTYTTTFTAAPQTGGSAKPKEITIELDGK